ncbi:MAG TPA: VCBS repeat-containing protein [Thermoanaerobaculia bacterium]|nr:VCBS repeat-containing protein [Thermoanaerobaculia bacterium]
MKSHSPSFNRGRLRVPRIATLLLAGIGLLAAFSLAGCRSAAPANPKTAASKASTAPAAEATPAEAKPGEMTAPAKKVLTPGQKHLEKVESEADQELEKLPVKTDSKRRHYRALKVKLVPYNYVWVNKEHTKIRLRPGVSYDVDHATKEAVWVKVYLPPKVKPKVTPVGPPPLSPEQRVKIAQSYEVKVPVEKKVTLVPFDAGLPKSGQWRNWPAVADMNGDGHPDIVHGPARKGRAVPAIFLGDGQGHWRLWRQATFPPLHYDYGAVTTGDFNGDGHMDMALAMHLLGVVVLTGDGHGHFTNWSTNLHLRYGKHKNDAIFSARDITTVDWNGDGRLDLIALAEGPTSAQQSTAGSKYTPYGIAVLLNQGDGTWKLADLGSSASKGGNFGDGVTLADFNGDGRIDVATGSNVAGWTDPIYLHQADGTLEPERVEQLRPGFTGAVASADFDHDGRPDLVVGYTADEGGTWRSGIDVLFNRADGFERVPVAVSHDRAGIWGLATGDLDGDGHTDIVGLTGRGGVIVLLGDGKGGFVRNAQELTQPRNLCRGYGVLLKDLDGNGRDEIVADFAGEKSASPMLMGGSGPTGCPGGGSLRVWTVQESAPAGH